MENEYMSLSLVGVASSRPKISGSCNSGAIHRTVDLKLETRVAVFNVSVPYNTVDNPKSARHAWPSSSTSMFVYEKIQISVSRHTL